MPNELTLRGQRIRRDHEGRVCLNDIHKTAGFSKNQLPYDWLRGPSAAREIVAVLTLITGKSRSWSKEEMKSAYYTQVGRDGGTWAHENLALGYAAYLSPALAVEIRDVFLRYKRGDESLVGEIRENKARREVADHELHRKIGKDVRKRFTKTLDEHGVTKPIEYASCTNEVYKPILGGTAKQVREERGLHPKANLRDNMSISELAFTMASEALASERIEHQSAQGFIECRDATKRASLAIKSAIDSDRRNRQQKML